MALPLLARLMTLGKHAGQLGKTAGKAGMDFGRRAIGRGKSVASSAAEVGRLPYDMARSGIAKSRLYQNYPGLTKVGGSALGAGAIGAGAHSMFSDDAAWIPIEYNSKMYKFKATPEAMEIMSLGNSSEAFDELVESGLIIPIEDESMDDTIRKDFFR